MKRNMNSSVFKGLFFALLSGATFSLLAVIVKYMKNTHPGQLAVYRYIALFALSIPEAVKIKQNLLGPKNLRFLLILRSIFAATTYFLNFIAFRYLPLGESSVIILSVPVFVTLAAKIFLKEPFGIFKIFTVITTVVGIVFAAKIPQKLAENSVMYTKEAVYGLSSAVGSLFCNTGFYILSRKLKDVHYSIALFSYGWIPIFETAILTAIVGNFQLPNCGLDRVYIIILGLLSFGSNVLLLMALQCEMAGPVTTVRAASDIVLAFAWQTFFFHEIPDLYSSVGAILVGVSVIFVALEKWISSLNEDSIYKKKLNWMLK